MTKITFLSVIALIFLASCSKNTPVDPTSKVYLLSGYTNSDYPFTSTYKYDDKNRVSSIINTGTSGTGEQKFYYNNNDQVIHEEDYTGTTLTTKIVYNYNSGSVSIDVTSGGSTTIGGKIYTLNSDGRPVKKTPGAGGPSYYTYTYDTAGNLINSGFYLGGTSPRNLYTYTYDNFKSPYLNIKGNFYFFSEQPGGVNNCTKLVESTEGSTTTSTTNYTYTYNADGYPLMRITSGATGSRTETFSYITE